MSASTQNQAPASLLFLYVRVLDHPVEMVQDFVRAKRPERLPAVLTPAEVDAVLDIASGCRKGRMVCRGAAQLTP